MKESDAEDYTRLNNWFQNVATALAGSLDKLLLRAVGLFFTNPNLSLELYTAQEFDTVEVSAELVEKFGELFALRVIGTRMIDALINDGDVVVIKPTRCAKDGEIVVVWFRKEETAILRKFYSEGDYIRLQPANSTTDPYIRP